MVYVTGLRTQNAQSPEYGIPLASRRAIVDIITGHIDDRHPQWRIQRECENSEHLRYGNSRALGPYRRDRNGRSS